MPGVLSRLVRNRLNLSPGEGRLVALMGALLATILFAYTIAKVLRDGLFLGEFGALSLPYAYIAVAFGSAAYVWLESRVAARAPRLGALGFTQTFAFAASVLLAAALPHARHVTTAFFYLWTSTQAMMLLPHFWALALDVWNSRRARVLFPILGGCGLLGGIAGGAAAAAGAKALGQERLIWILPPLLLLVRLLTALVERHRTARPSPLPAAAGGSGWEIVRRSGYIKVLALALVFSVVIATLVDFQFKIFVQKMYPEPYAMTRFLGTFQMAMNAVSLLLQFGATGWLLQRLGLGPSTGLQPGAVLLFALWASITAGGWPVIVMRWLQGTMSVSLGKSSTEIYYAAVRGRERRRIKPALDLLIERWSDAVVGVMLLVVLRLLGLPPGVVLVGTATVAGVWLIVLLRLDRHYGRAFEEALSRRFLDPELPPESLRLPAARRAIVGALASEDSAQVTLALLLARHARDPRIAEAVRRALRHSSDRVRIAAVEAMRALRLRDPEGTIEAFVAAPDEELRHAAIAYMVSPAGDPLRFARPILEGDDAALQAAVLDALADEPAAAMRLLTWSWIDDRMIGGPRHDAILAAKALGALEGPPGASRLRRLLAHPDLEVRRVALVAAARRPQRSLADVLLPQLEVAPLTHEAREAIVALGGAMVPGLRRLLQTTANERVRVAATRALAQIGTPRALEAILVLVRSGDRGLRYVGLRGMTHLRLLTGRPVLSRAAVHRLFLREMADYRACQEPALALAAHPAPELRLLADSCRESADRALERAMQVLACWYEPKPLVGALERLKTTEKGGAAPALEYLGRILPRRIFRVVDRLFESGAPVPADGAADSGRLAAAIGAAWDSGDVWLRACAVRASRLVPEFDRGRFSEEPGALQQEDPGAAMVCAELKALEGAAC